MTTYELNLNNQPVNTSDILNTLCMYNALAIEEGIENAYTNIFIPVSKSVTVFAEVQMDNMTRKAVYYVTSSKNQSATIQSMNYRQAVSKLNLLLAA